MHSSDSLLKTVSSVFDCYNRSFCDVEQIYCPAPVSAPRCHSSQEQHKPRVCIFNICVVFHLFIFFILPTHFDPSNVGISLWSCMWIKPVLHSKFVKICVKFSISSQSHCLGNSICPCEKEKVMSPRKIRGQPHSASTRVLYKSNLFVEQALLPIAMVTVHSQ